MHWIVNCLSLCCKPFRYHLLSLQDDIKLHLPPCDDARGALFFGPFAVLGGVSYDSQ
jgi:hypothetical protein